MGYSNTAERQWPHLSYLAAWPPGRDLAADRCVAHQKSLGPRALSSVPEA
jgi:hypothetical protein